MPLKLKSVLVRHGIRQSDVCNNVRLSSGQTISSSGLSMICNWGRWPRLTSEQDIKAQINTLLRANGVPEIEIAEAFEIDVADSGRHAHPVNVHIGQTPTKQPLGPRNGLKSVAAPVIEPPPEVKEMLSQEAKKHFQLFRDPFQADVNCAEDIYLSEDGRYIRQAMHMTAKHGGFIAVVAESGAGKSVLRRDLVDRVGRDSSPIRIIFPRSLDKTKLSASNICEAIINDLQPGVTVRSSLEAKARQVEQMLIASAQADNSHVLVIEEAHDLSIQTIKYLKRFFELEDGFKKLLGIILIGQPELKDKLDERRYPEAREVIRRIEIAELAPLDNNLADYLAFKFKRIEKDAASLFDESAIDAIRARLTRVKPGTREVQSSLFPLSVNNLVTRALNRSAALKLPMVTGDLVKEL